MPYLVARKAEYAQISYVLVAYVGLYLNTTAWKHIRALACLLNVDFMYVVKSIDKVE